MSVQNVICLPGKTKVWRKIISPIIWWQWDFQVQWSLGDCKT